MIPAIKLSAVMLHDLLNNMQVESYLFPLDLFQIRSTTQTKAVLGRSNDYPS